MNLITGYNWDWGVPFNTLIFLNTWSTVFSGGGFCVIVGLLF